MGSVNNMKVEATMVSTSISISSAITAFAVQALPVLQCIATVVAIAAGIVTIYRSFKVNK